METRCARAKRIVCPLVSVNKSALLNYSNVLWLRLSRLKWNRICPKGKRDRRIIGHQQLPFDDCLQFTKRCAGTFVCISPELPKSLLTRPALACKVIPFTFPQDLRQGDPPPQHQTGEQIDVEALLFLGLFYNQNVALRSEIPCPGLCY